MMSCQRKLPWWNVAVIALAGMSLSSCGPQPVSGPAEHASTDKLPAPEYSQEVRAVLEKKIQLVTSLAADAVVVDTVRKANRANEPMSDKDIAKLEKQWSASPQMNELAKSLVINECAQRLIDFQEQHDGFPEIFVTDARGLIAAATNRTSDYLQADEPWWNETFNAGKGKSHYGAIEYDESAYSESIPLYVPIIDPQTSKAIGVLKAVCDITAIKMEL